MLFFYAFIDIPDDERGKQELRTRVKYSIVFYSIAMRRTVIAILAITAYLCLCHPEALSLPEGAIAKLGKENIDQNCKSIAFSPDGTALAAGTSIGIYLYDLPTYAEIDFIESIAPINSVAFSPDGKLLAGGNDDGTLFLWNMVTRQKVITLPELPPDTPEGALKALAEIDIENVNLQDYFPLKTGNRWQYDVIAESSVLRKRTMRLGEREKVHHPANVIEAFPPDADIDQPFFICNVGLTESAYGYFSEWYAISGNMILYRGTISSLPWGENARLSSLVFLEAEMILDKEIITVPRGTFACIKILRDNSCNLDVLPLDPTRYAPIDSMPVYEWYSEGFGMVKREYKLYDPYPTIEREIECSEVLTGYSLTGNVSSVSFSPNGDILASANLNGMISLLDTELLQEVSILKHPEIVISAAFSPDGRMLASAGLGDEGGTVKLWDVTSNKEMATIEAHEGWAIFSVAFSPDGRLLAGGSADGVVYLWDVGTHQEVFKFTSQRELLNMILSVAFSPDGRFLASGSADGKQV